MKETDFIRKRKLPFWHVIVLILSEWKSSMQNRLNKFFESLGKIEEVPTSSAYCQSREKLNPEIFNFLSEESVKFFYNEYEKEGYVKRWKWYLLWAVDCTRVNHPNTEEMREKYSVQRNQHDTEGVCQGLSRCLYDVLNEISINSCLGKKKSEKLFIFEKHKEYYRKEAIVLYDRSYVDYAVIAYHIKAGIDFIIRGKCGKTFKEVENFVKSNKTDGLVKLRATERQKELIAREGLAEEVTIRVVKVILDNGDTEILLTSLRDDTIYKPEDFKEVYNKRWGVETYFDRIKNQLEIEHFSSDKVNNMEQDFYGIIFLSIVESILIKRENEEMIEYCEKKERKYPYKINKSVSYSAILDHVFELFLDDTTSGEELVDKLRKIFKTGLTPVRRGRNFERKRTTPSKKSRYYKYSKRYII
jgi:hypothetical protein